MRRHFSVPALVLTLTAALLVSLALLPASADARPASADRTAPGLVIKYNSWGKLKLGMNKQQAWGSGMVSHEAGHCAPGYLLKARFRTRGTLIWTWTKTSKVQEIVITGKRDHTQKHIHVGSTLRQLRHAYPGLSGVRHSRAAVLDRSTAASTDDLYFASVHSHAGVINFQFAYGPAPKPSSKIDTIVVAKKTAVYWGC